MVANYQRDGQMQVGENGGANPNYRPNSFDDIVVDENYKEPPIQLDSTIADWFDRNQNDNDHYTQPGNLYRQVMKGNEKKNLVNNIVSSMKGISGEKRIEIINRVLCHLFRIDIKLGMSVASGLGIDIDEKAMNGN
jgi:catalase